MAKGQRVSLASLASAVGQNSPVEQGRPKPTESSGGAVPLADLTPNPHNPREDVGDLADLESIADMQLQPAVVITKAAYLRLYPDESIDTRYVVVNGCRRLAAAHKYGRTDLSVVVNDEVARDRVTLISASITENVDRQDFDVIEEAKAVESLVRECGTAEEAAHRLKRTGGWVSQRRALLQLDPEIQLALRRGELAIREARSLARVPLEQQVARWRAAQEKKDNGEGNGRSEERPPSPSRTIARALDAFDERPDVLADALRGYLGPNGVKTLVEILGAAHGNAS